MSTPYDTQDLDIVAVASEHAFRRAMPRRTPASLPEVHCEPAAPSEELLA